MSKSGKNPKNQVLEWQISTFVLEWHFSKCHLLEWHISNFLMSLSLSLSHTRHEHRATGGAGARKGQGSELARESWLWVVVCTTARRSEGRQAQQRGINE